MKKLLKKLEGFFNINKLGAIAKEIYYIGGSDILPPPLTKDEEDSILTNFPDDEAKALLIERNLRLVVYIARKFVNTGIGVEDLI